MGCHNLIKLFSTHVEQSSIPPFPVACTTFTFNYFWTHNLNIFSFDRLENHCSPGTVLEPDPLWARLRNLVTPQFTWPCTLCLCHSTTYYEISLNLHNNCNIINTIEHINTQTYFVFLIHINSIVDQKTNS